MLSFSECTTTGVECISEQGKADCIAARGHCGVQRDGYYIMSFVCIALGASLLVGFILPTVKRLQGKYAVREWTRYND